MAEQDPGATSRVAQCSWEEPGRSMLLGMSKSDTLGRIPPKKTRGARGRFAHAACLLRSPPLAGTCPGSYLWGRVRAGSGRFGPVRAGSVGQRRASVIVPPDREACGLLERAQPNEEGRGTSGEDTKVRAQAG